MTDRDRERESVCIGSSSVVSEASRAAVEAGKSTQSLIDHSDWFNPFAWCVCVQQSVFALFLSLWVYLICCGLNSMLPFSDFFALLSCGDHRHHHHIVCALIAKHTLSAYVNIVSEWNCVKLRTRCRLIFFEIEWWWWWWWWWLSAVHHISHPFSDFFANSFLFPFPLHQLTA